MPAEKLIEEAAGAEPEGMWLEFQNLLRADPHRLAVIDDRGYAATRSELEEMAAALAAEMTESGLAAGDVIIICLPNWAEWMAVYLAALKLSLIPGSLPVTSDAKSLGETVAAVGAATVVLPAVHRKRDFGNELHDVARHAGRRLTALLMAGDFNGHSWAEIDGPEPAGMALPADTAHILFSSSTTGKSKAIAHSESSLAAYNRGVIDRYGVRGEQAIFMPSPLGHSTGFWHGARMSIMTGASLVLQDAWDPDAAIRLCSEHHCAITVAATPFLTDLCNANPIDDEPKLKHMRVFLCGGAPIPPSVIAEAHTELPETKVCSIWAMSEGGATSSLMSDSIDTVASTCGAVLPGTELEVVDEHGDIAPRGSAGEVVMKTDSLFLGYIGRNDLYTSAFTSEGYFRTGDIGIVDKADYLTVTGRLKDLIIRGGVNISPIEIESILIDHPGIARVAVVGEPDERMGERICAVIQPVTGDLEFDELINWLKASGIAPRKWPESIRIVNSMPVTPAGKIRKHALRDVVVCSS